MHIGQKCNFCFFFSLLLFQLLIISQSSTSRALSWIQSKLGKQYLWNKVTLPWESNPGPTPIRGDLVTIILIGVDNLLLGGVHTGEEQASLNVVAPLWEKARPLEKDKAFGASEGLEPLSTGAAKPSTKAIICRKILKCATFVAKR